MWASGDKAQGFQGRLRVRSFGSAQSRETEGWSWLMWRFNVEQVSMHEKQPQTLPSSPGQAFASWGAWLNSEVTSAATVREPGQIVAPVQGGTGAVAGSRGCSGLMTSVFSVQ